MKSTTISLLSLSALSLLTSCTFVDTPAPAPSTHTTTTSEVASPVYGSTETTTTRTY